MNLTANTHTIELVTATADAVDWCVSWTDIDKSGAATVTTPGSNQGTVSAATTTTIVAAPASNVYRVITNVTVRNRGSGTQTITVQKDVAGSNFTLVVMTLYTGEFAVYEDGRGWARFDSSGSEKINALNAGGKTATMLADHFATANLTSTKTITSGSSFAVYLGKAPRALTSVQVRCRVTTAAATITWAEMALAKGPVSVGANPNLTVVGYADVAAVINSTGQKTVTINVASGQAITEGDDLWVLIGNAATTAAVFRAQSIADDLQVGVQASLATRPSLNVGTGQAYTLEGATTLAAWVALIV